MASLEAMIAGDYAIFDGIETVRLTTVGPNNEKDQSVAGALRERLSGSERMAFGASYIESDRTIWSLPVVNCGGLVPKSGDVIRGADDVNWLIEGTAEKLTRNSRYRCMCVKQR